MIYREIRIFFTALMFYTRFPCPAWTGYSNDYMNQSTKYFPLIGWIVGGGSALVFYGGLFLFPPTVAVVLAMAAGIWITGAFHEDGLADTCDGFGGGWTAEQILEIMKDSRTGSYGVAGLMLVLLLKYATLVALPVAAVPAVLIAGHALSRFSAASLIYTLPYARADGNSKAKPVAKNLSVTHLLIAALFGLLPLLLLRPFLLWALIPVAASRAYLTRYFRRWIGGYTGDCLGASQQIGEVAFYLGILGAWEFISSSTLVLL